MGDISQIELRQVTRLFGATAALRSVDLSFSPGTINFVQGPNGAGKSTLVAIVGTVLRATSGQVLYHPIGANRRKVRRHIGRVAHDCHCYGELSGRANVELAARLYGVDPKEAWERTSARVHAGRFAKQPVNTLSRGQKQRVALARALVHRPSVLLLDEPLSGLDQASVRRMEQILEEECDLGTIVIVITHMQGIAERLEGRRVQLEGGRVVEDTGA